MPPVYAQLDATKSEIRVLSLLPDPDSEPIRCTLKTVSLDVHTEYDALSYGWGDPHDQREVFVDDHPTQVTVNLETALRALRRQGLLTIWADAICINQSDAAEKNVQVPLMGRVYAEARSVLVWLGEPTDEMVAFGSWLSELSGLADQICESILLRSLARFQIKRLAYLVYGWKDMLERPYWQRMWTFQEFRLSTKGPIMLCSNGHFPAVLAMHGGKAIKVEMEKFLKGCREEPLGESEDTLEGRIEANAENEADRASRKTAREPEEHVLVNEKEEGESGEKAREDSDGPDRSLLSPRSYGYTNLVFPGWMEISLLIKPIEVGSSLDNDLVQLLTITSSRQSLDPRDHVYAVYGLLPILNDISPIDYNKPVRKVMYEITVYILRECPLHWCFLSQFFSPYTDRLISDDSPSWTLDFSTHVQMYSGNNYICGDKAASSLTAEEELAIVNHGKTIFLQARSMGTCKNVLRLGDTLDEVIAGLEAFLLPIEDSTVSSNRLAPAVISRSDQSEPEAIHRVVERLLAICRTDVDTIDNKPNQWILESDLLRLHQMTIFFARGEHLGISVSSVQEGDIMIFSHRFGCPIVFRPCAICSETPHLNATSTRVRCGRLVDLAYVHGAMLNDCVDVAFVEELQKLDCEQFLIN